MKIVVTGGAGFIASNVVDAYAGAGHEVVVVDDLSSGNRKNVDPKCKFYEADVSSPELLKIIEKERPDVINHHAAQIDVRRSVEDPAFDARVNIMGMINACKGAVSVGTKKIIFSSSGGVLYGEVPAAPAGEESPIEPLSPYGVSKLSSEAYVRYFSHEHGLKFTILRYANVYGPRQIGGEAGVVAIFLRAMLRGAKTVIFDDGAQERDFVYVGDVVRANVMSLSAGDNETLNIGTGRAASVNEIHRILSGLTNYRGEKVFGPKRAGELKRSVLACGRAGEKLGWRPEKTLEKGLELTLKWFKNNAG